MKRLLQLGFVLGFGGTIAAAYFLPLVEYERYRSEASVAANGGRIEQFLIRLPADRIDPAGGSSAVAAAIGQDAASPPRLEHFKLRDVKDNVIGVATRHATVVDGRAETAWLLVIPSRGMMVLTGADAAQSVEAALAARGWQPGQGADQDLSIDLGGPAHSVTATGEFSGIEFELVETWVVSGLDADGGIRGTLRLNTIGKRAS
jgi:hypothetical protein